MNFQFKIYIFIMFFILTFLCNYRFWSLWSDPPIRNFSLRWILREIGIWVGESYTSSLLQSILAWKLRAEKIFLLVWECNSYYHHEEMDMISFSFINNYFCVCLVIITWTSNYYSSFVACVITFRSTVLNNHVTDIRDSDINF
jgi:hypothetical protein